MLANELTQVKKGHWAPVASTLTTTKPAYGEQARVTCFGPVKFCYMP